MIYPEIHHKIQAFKRKFYFFSALKGLFILLFYFTLSLILVSILNYFFYLNHFVKNFIFWSYLFLILIFSIKLFFLPLFKAFIKLPALNDKFISKIIRNNFPEINDILLNIIELYELNPDDKIILASIKQKYESIKFLNFDKYFPKKSIFSKAILLIIPFFIAFILQLYNPNLLRIGTYRFVNYKNISERFSIELLNKSLMVTKGSSIKIKFRIYHKLLIPTHILVSLEDNLISPSYDRQKDYYYFNIKNITKSIHFRINIDDYKSGIYIIKIINKPFLSSYKITITPPKYLRQNKLTITNFKTIIVPEGSNIFLKFNTINTDSVIISSPDAKHSLSNPFVYKFNVFKTKKYNILLKNKYFTDTISSFSLVVLKDRYPAIKLNQSADSINLRFIHFKGVISDDYGFTSLKFYYYPTKYQSPAILTKFKSVNIEINNQILEQNFDLTVDFSKLVHSSDSICYFYFAVSDNDALHHYKTTKTSIFKYLPFTTQKIDSINKKLDSTVNKQFNSQFNYVRDIENSITNFRQKSLNEKVSSWEQLDFLNNLINQNKNLSNILDSLIKENKFQLTNLEVDSASLRKKLKLQNILDSILKSKINDILKKLDSLKKNFNPKDFDKFLEELRQNLDNYQKNLKLTNQLFKRLQIQEKLKLNAKELSNLSEKIKKEIDKLNRQNYKHNDSINQFYRQYKRIMNNFDSTLKQNKELHQPLKIQTFKTDFKKIDSSFNSLQNKESTSSLHKKKTSLKQISKQLNSLSQKIKSSLVQSTGSQHSEDIQYIKQLLSDLLTLSFNQENIYLKSSQNLSIFSKTYTKLVIQQNDLFDNYQLLRDSLYNLAERNLSVTKPIMNIISEIDNNFAKMKSSNNQHKSEIYMRNLVTNFNKLCLILNESLKHMNQAQSNSMSSGTGQKQSGKGQMQNIKKLQEQIQQELEQMLKKIGQGKTPSAEQLAKQIAKREMLNKLLQQQINNSENLNLQKMMNQIKELNNKNIKDILNNNLSNNLLLRENLIKTKLLESDKARKQQNLSNKRISSTSRNIKHIVTNNLKKNNIKNKANTFMYFKTNQLSLTNFYKKYYDAYVIRSSSK